MSIEELLRTPRGRLGPLDGIEPKDYGEGLTAIELRNRFGTGRILLQGAQLLEWTPVRQEPIVWLSPNAIFKAGTPPRGGVPVCWPWFGPHGTNPDFPAHGYARTAQWALGETLRLDDDSHQLTFTLICEGASHPLWPYPTPLTLTYKLGESMEIELLTRNDAPQPVTLSQALHTYFGVGDVRRVRIRGLDGCDYIDKVDQGHRRQQAGDIKIFGETDRIYLNTTATCVIEDPILNRRIHIEKQGSRSTVVWNPWAEKSAKMGDFTESGYLNMVCVESGNVADDQVTLTPGEENRLWVRYTWANGV